MNDTIILEILYEHLVKLKDNFQFGGWKVVSRNNLNQKA